MSRASNAAAAHGARPFPSTAAVTLGSLLLVSCTEGTSAPLDAESSDEADASDDSMGFGEGPDSSPDGASTTVASGNRAGWTPMPDSSTPGEVRRLVPLASGGYAALVDLPNGDSAIYRYNGGRGAQATWTALPTLPSMHLAQGAMSGSVGDLAELDGRLYVAGPFSWTEGDSFPTSNGAITIGVLREVRRLAVSIDLSDPQANWVALPALGEGIAPCLDDQQQICSDFMPSSPLFLHAVPTGALRGVYLLGGGLSESDLGTSCGTLGLGSGPCGQTVFKIAPTVDTMAGGLGVIGVASGTSGTKALAAAHGAMQLAPGQPPVEVLVVGGMVHVDEAGVPHPKGFGLGAWDGTSWHSVATGIERFPENQCNEDLCSVTLQQSVQGLAFVGTDLYVAGNFATVPLDAAFSYDATSDWLGGCGTMGQTCQRLNGFARVRDGRWQALRDSRYALPGLASSGFGSPMSKRLVATQDSVLVLGGPWVQGTKAGANVPDEVVLPPYGADATLNGILRWSSDRWDTLQGGTHCYEPSDGCTAIVHDVAPVSGSTSFFVAGGFTGVGRSNVAETDRLAVFTPSSECTGDLNNDGTVDGADMGVVLSMWGYAGSSTGDLDDSGIVDGADLGIILSAWGTCPEPLAPCGQPLFDERDGKTYATTLVGTQCWMADNLDYGVLVSAAGTGPALDDDGNAEKLCYANASSNCAQYGALYEWGEAMAYLPSDGLSAGRTRGICPEGWHLPTDLEVQRLEHAIGMSSDSVVSSGFRGSPLATKLKVGGTTGLDLLLAGLRIASSGSYQGLGAGGGFWTATSAEAAQAWSRRIDTTNAIGRVAEPATSALAVRCVRD
jgi:uncharacterized protein (TIGR02145 family)